MLEFQTRFENALRRRLFPNAPLHLKEIAGGIGRSENTVARWWRGETRVAGDDLYRLALFFSRRGDGGFLREVFDGLVVTKPVEPPAQPDIVTVVRAVFAEINSTAPSAPDLHHWFLADGTMAEASAGHAEFVRRSVQLPPGLGDIAGYAMRVLGWMALTERGDGTPIIRHDGIRLAPLAAERACEWLEDRADLIRNVRRCVHVNGRWVDATHPSAVSAATAIEKAAFILAKPRRRWVVSRLSLDEVADPVLRELLQAYYQQPDKIIDAAARLGAFSTSSLFGISGTNVISHHVATGFGPGLDPRAIIGLNVLARPDTDYGVMLQGRVLLTCREGPNFHELTGTIDDNYVRYLNLSIPDGGNEGRVLTSTVLLDLERMSA